MNVVSAAPASATTADTAETEATIIVTLANDQLVFSPERVLFRVPAGTVCTLWLKMADEVKLVFATGPDGNPFFRIAESSTVVASDLRDDGRTLRLELTFPELFLLQGLMVYAHAPRSDSETADGKVYHRDPQVGNDPPVN
jgi:hypothetical protein